MILALMPASHAAALERCTPLFARFANSECGEVERVWESRQGALGKKTLKKPFEMHAEH
jgi:hypothetical protein